MTSLNKTSEFFNLSPESFSSPYSEQTTQCVFGHVQSYVTKVAFTKSINVFCANREL